jgi:hypothetical protein
VIRPIVGISLALLIVAVISFDLCNRLAQPGITISALEDILIIGRYFLLTIALIFFSRRSRWTRLVIFGEIVFYSIYCFYEISLNGLLIFYLLHFVLMLVFGIGWIFISPPFRQDKKS